MNDETKQDITNLKSITKEKCSKINNKLNNLDLKKRKLIIICGFSIGLFFLMINVFVVNNINTKKEKTNVNYEDSLTIVVKEIDILLRNIEADSTYNNFNIKAE